MSDTTRDLVSRLLVLGAAIAVCWVPLVPVTVMSIEAGLGVLQSVLLHVQAHKATIDSERRHPMSELPAALIALEHRYGEKERRLGSCWTKSYLKIREMARKKRAAERRGSPGRGTYASMRDRASKMISSPSTRSCSRGVAPAPSPNPKVRPASVREGDE